MATGASTEDIKTHPKASHIVCSRRTRGQAVEEVRFDVDCGRAIEPTGRNFIVIGAMKAGTTTLFELLAQHPALCRTWAQLPSVSFPKEINYFLKLYRKSHTALYYDWRFPFDASGHAWTLEVSPGYTKWPRSKAVPARIASLGGDTRLAYILRDPIDRIESHLAHNLQGGRHITKLGHYIRTSSYAMQLDKYMAHFSSDDILLLDFEQLRRKPAAVLAQVCDFLAIDRVAGTSQVHNRRGIHFRLDARQRAELAKAIRPDVQRLISDYGFEPAERWLRRFG